MKCPSCGYLSTTVTDSRKIYSDLVVKRRRTCPKCKLKFITEEAIKFPGLRVKKRNQTVEPFDTEKLMRSLQIATRKLRIDYTVLVTIQTRIIQALTQYYPRVIATQEIGVQILDELLHVNEVAYIRYASVFKDFSTVEDFSRTIQEYQKNHALS